MDFIYFPVWRHYLEFGDIQILCPWAVMMIRGTVMMMTKMTTMMTMMMILGLC